MKDPDLISSNSSNGDLTAQQIAKLKHSISLNDQQIIKFNNNVKVLSCNNQVKELHTVLRDV
jgi:hypothetical protein